MFWAGMLGLFIIIGLVFLGGGILMAISAIWSFICSYWWILIIIMVVWSAWVDRVDPNLKDK